MAGKKRNVEGPVEFPYAENPDGPLRVSAVRFRSAWQRFAVQHRTDVGPDGSQYLPLLASNSTLLNTKKAGRGCGFDVLCREIVGACHWDMRQAETRFFSANAHIVEKVSRIRPGAKRPTAHVRLLPREDV